MFYVNGLKRLTASHAKLFSYFLLHFLLMHLVLNIYAKFEVSSFNSSRDMEGVAEF